VTRPTQRARISTSIRRGHYAIAESISRELIKDDDQGEPTSSEPMASRYGHEGNSGERHDTRGGAEGPGGAGVPGAQGRIITSRVDEHPEAHEPLKGLGENRIAGVMRTPSPLGWGVLERTANPPA
jgi:hypothetical protein